MINTVGRRGIVVLGVTALLGVAPLAGHGGKAHADGPVWGSGRAHHRPTHTPTHRRHKAPKHRPGRTLAKLSVRTKSPGVPVLPGRTYNWPYSVTNSSGVKSGPVVFTAPLPMTMQFVSAQQNCSWQGGAAVCVLGELGAGQTKAGVITAKVSIGAAPGQPITSPAVVRWDTGQETTNFPAVTVVPTADVQVVKAGPPLVRPGKPVPYEITVTNNGPAVAHSVLLRDNAEAQTRNGPVLLIEQQSEAACSGGGSEGGQGGEGGRGSATTCALGDMQVGESRTVHVRALAGPSLRPGTPIQAPSLVTSPTLDTNLANNHAVAMTKIAPGVPLARPAMSTGRQIVHANSGRPGLPNTGAPIISMLHTVAALLGAGLILYRLGRPRRRRGLRGC